MLHDDDLPIEKMQLFAKVFSEFTDYNFLWKCKCNLIAQNLSTNVWMRPWFPQSDILGHSKLKVFVTHGGLINSLFWINWHQFNNCIIIRSIKCIGSNLARHPDDCYSAYVRSI